MRRILDRSIVAIAALTLIEALQYGRLIYGFCGNSIRSVLRFFGGPLNAFTLPQVVADSPTWLKILKDAAATLQSLATVAALLVGAWWVLKRRRIYPHAKFTHVISHVGLDAKSILLHVAIQVENVGDVLLPIGPVVVCAQQLKPLPVEHRKRLDAGEKLLPDGAVDVDWPILDRCDQDLKGHELEPGECGAFDFDLVIPSDAETVIVYSYFTNLAKTPQEIGWSTSTMYHTNSEVSDQRGGK
jgi:hypothetical protein